MNSTEEIIADERLIVRDSGEIPEVALHGSIHYLCHDPEGPRITLGKRERRTLRQAAVERFKEIILRDLTPENRDLPLYRGPMRTLFNWRRYCVFCEREGMEVDQEFRRKTARAMTAFIGREMKEYDDRGSAINCDAAAIAELALCLGLDPTELPPGWEKLCPGPD